MKALRVIYAPLMLFFQIIQGIQYVSRKIDVHSKSGRPIFFLNAETGKRSQLDDETIER